ncbi:MAG: hypothetical protein ACLQBK_03100 [Candidatus Sulfotelmatobacter sp.]
MDSSVEDFERALENYKTNYRRSDVPELEISGRYILFPNTAEAGKPSCWPAEYEHSKRVGVYVICGGSGRVLYVGRSWFVGRRLFDYFGCGAEPDVSMKWTEKPMFVVTVAVPQTMEWEAAGLEELLIDHLHPPDNTRIRR